MRRVPLARRKAYDRALAETIPGWFEERHRAPRWMVPRRDRHRSYSAIVRLWARLKRDAIERAL